MPEFQRWTCGRRGALAVFVGYLLGAFAVTLGAWRDPTSGWAGGCCDPEQAIWFLGWTPHALAHGLDPFFATQLNAPAGVNLMWNPSMPLLGLLGWLPAKVGGPIFGFNVLMVAGIALSGSAAWLAIRRWTGDRVGPIVGGATYAFSPYVVSHAALHLNLATAWGPPLLLIALDELLGTRRPAWQPGVALGVLAAVQLLISEEVLATSVVAGAVLVCVRAVALRQWPSRILPGLAAAAPTFLILAGWPLAAQFSGAQRIRGRVQDPAAFSTDLHNLVVPTPYQLIAPRGWHAAGGLDHEATAYLGAPLLVLAVVVAIRYRDDLRIRIASVTGATMLALSLGPWLHVGNHALRVPLPWLAVGKLPLLEHVLPGRMTLYVWLAVAVMVATVIARAARPAATKGWLLAVGAALILLLPAPLPRAPFTTPTFFRNWANHHIGAGETVLVAPYFVDGSEAAPMVWAAETHYRLRMPEAYAYLPQPDGSTSSGPPQSQLTFIMYVIQQRGGWLVARDDIRAQVAADLESAGIRHVIVGPGRHWQQMIAFFTDLFGRPPDLVDEVALWRDVSVDANPAY